MISITVRERPDRKHLQLAYTDPMTGAVRTKSAQTSDWKIAERAAAKWEDEIKQQHGLTDTNWQYFRRRYEDEHLATLRKNTAQTYGHALDKFESIVGMPRSLQLINSSVLSQFSAESITAPCSMVH